MSSPRIVTFEPVIVRPSAVPAWLPLSSISGAPANPGWDVAVDEQLCVIAGRDDSGVITAALARNREVDLMFGLWRRRRNRGSPGGASRGQRRRCSRQ